MRYVFIINPTAGKTKLQTGIAEEIRSFFEKNGGDYRLVITERAGHAREVAMEEARSGKDVRIYAAGGEGTAFEVLNGAYGYGNVEIGVIPCGSANDFLKYFGDRDAFLSIREQVDGTAFPIDIIKADEFYAFNQCSAGLDAVVAYNMTKFKDMKGVSGSTAYKLALIYTFFTCHGLSMEITVDGQKLDGVDGLFAVCANGPVYGGGFISAPKAIPDDGLLDYSVINIKNKVKVLSVMGTYRAGKHLGKKYSVYGNCRSMEFCSKEPIPINLDGEIIYRDRVKFELVRGGARFIIPKSLAESFGQRPQQQSGQLSSAV